MTTQITIEDLKVGMTIEKTITINGKIDRTVKWVISNITDKSIMYRDGESHVFQTNKIEIKKYSVKKFLTLMNKGYKSGSFKSEFKIVK